VPFKVHDLWDMTPCGLVNSSYRCFGEACYLRRHLEYLKTQTSSFPELLDKELVPKDLILHQNNHHCENMKAYKTTSINIKV